MWLDQLQDAGAFVLEDTANATMEDYASDRRLRQAVDRNLQIMADSLLRLERADSEIVKQLPGYRAVVGLRKGLSYGYERPPNEHIWEVIQDVLPVLHRSAVSLLREAEDEHRGEPTLVAVGCQTGGRNGDDAGKPTCLDNPAIAQHLHAIRNLCREYGVLRFEVFGSVCTPDFDPTRSDVDFLVEYPEDYEFGPWLKRYFEFQERLEDLLGRPVDLVMVGAPRNKYFIRSMNETKELLYAA